jgi:NADH-quinone oxidoreductase subunit J
MMGWIFAGFGISAVLMATFARQIRHAVLALWVAGLSIGGVYLTLGAEFLAIIQWIVSTLVTLSFIFFAVMFGEYHSPTPRTSRHGMLLPFLSLFVGAGFTTIIWLGAKDLSESASVNEVGTSDLAVIGKMLTQENLLSLEVLALTLFLVLVGGGVIARFEGGNEP